MASSSRNTTLQQTGAGIALQISSMNEEQLIIHTRLPKRLVKLLDHYAIDLNLYRAEALARILEEWSSRPVIETDPQAAFYRDGENPNEVSI